KPSTRCTGCLTLPHGIAQTSRSSQVAPEPHPNHEYLSTTCTLVGLHGQPVAHSGLGKTSGLIKRLPRSWLGGNFLRTITDALRWRWLSHWTALPGGGGMAVAGAVVACESRSLDWLTIADDEGNVWRYVKRGLAQTVAGVHVTWWYDELLTVRPRLVR